MLYMCAEFFSAFVFSNNRLFAANAVKRKISRVKILINTIYRKTKVLPEVEAPAGHYEECREFQRYAIFFVINASL